MLVKLEQSLVRIQGIDAAKFLQGQLCCDVLKLADGSHTLTAHCNPQGKVQSLLRLYRQTESVFYALIANEILPSTLQDLQKYAIFSKVEFEQLTWQLYGCPPERATRPENQKKFSIFLSDGREIFACENELAGDFNDYAHWQITDMQAGFPLLNAQAQNQFLPQALNLDQIEQAISFSKGCYIGQEGVARAKYRGTNKRSLHCFHTAITSCDNGSAIEIQQSDHWRKTGYILSHAVADAKLWLQVVLPKDGENEERYRLNDQDLSIFH